MKPAACRPHGEILHPGYKRGMKQSPIRRLRRDRSRLQQELQLAQGTDDKAQIPILQKKIRDLDAEIAALESKKAGA